MFPTAFLHFDDAGLYVKSVEIQVPTGHKRDDIVRLEIRASEGVRTTHNSFLLQRWTMRSNENRSQRVDRGVFNAISPGIAPVIQSELTSKSSM
jgi:hypothetical protein